MRFRGNVLGAVYLAHPARANRGQDLVGAESGARCQGHISDDLIASEDAEPHPPISQIEYL